jgi:hypothetical protein
VKPTVDRDAGQVRPGWLGVVEELQTRHPGVLAAQTCRETDPLFGHAERLAQTLERRRRTELEVHRPLADGIEIANVPRDEPRRHLVAELGSGVAQNIRILVAPEVEPGDVATLRDLVARVADVARE